MQMAARSALCVLLFGVVAALATAPGAVPIPTPALVAAATAALKANPHGTFTSAELAALMPASASASAAAAAAAVAADAAPKSGGALGAANCAFSPYDLSGLSGSVLPGGSGSTTYKFSVCGSVSDGTSCRGALCSYSGTPQVVTTLAVWDASGVWSATDPNNASKGVTVVFNTGDQCQSASGVQPIPYQVTMLFSCQAGATGTSYSLANVGNKCKYTLQLQNQNACPGAGPAPGPGPDDGGGSKGLSGGSIFLIILVVVVPVYIVAGCVYKRQRQGTAGVESCPNIDFWRTLPGLVADGFKFTWKKCLALCGKGGDTSYEGMK